MQKYFRYLLFLVALAFATGRAHACDLCGCFTPQIEAMPEPELSAFGQTAPADVAHGGWQSHVYAAIAEQFTHFGTVQIDGREVSNPTGQYEDSSITQLVAGYNFNSRFSLQLNIPL